MVQLAPGEGERRRAEILRAVREGDTMARAAQNLGVAENTLTNWARENGLGHTERYRAALDPAAQEAMRVTGAETPPSHFWMRKPTDDGGFVSAFYKGPQERPEAFAERLRDMFADIPRAELRPAPVAPARDLVTYYPIADWHAGMHSWARETGEDYDLKIAEARLMDAANGLIATAPASAEAVVLNLGDLIHMDDARNVTPRSQHSLDVDGRYWKVVETGIRTVSAVIELASQRHEQVTYRSLPGNHDPHAHVAVTMGLIERYRGHNRVRIDAPIVHVKGDPSPFYAARHGRCAVFATHGDKAKPSALAHFVADEWPEIWGATRHRFIWSGHVHHDSAKDIGGVKWESFRALCPRDAHAFASAYASRQTMQAITLHLADGEVSRLSRTFVKQAA